VTDSSFFKKGDG
jgi:hypothetical protein